MFTRKKSIWIMQKFQTIHVTSIQSTKGASVDDVYMYYVLSIIKIIYKWKNPFNLINFIMQPVA